MFKICDPSKCDILRPNNAVESWENMAHAIIFKDKSQVGGVSLITVKRQALPCIVLGSP